MANDLKQVECDPICGFMIRSHDEKELEQMVIAHAKNAHNMVATPVEVRAKMKSV